MPIFSKRCVSCHSGEVAAAGLRLDIPGRHKNSSYHLLVWDYRQEFVPQALKVQVSTSSKPKRRYGLHRPNTSKYVNAMFARESLLYWKAANKRTDGRTDKKYNNDIDFGADYPTTIEPDELRVLAAWLDAGAYRQQRH